MREIALHLLDIIENSAAAGANAITVSILEDLDADRLLVRVEDNGNGIEEDILASITDPFYTSRTTRKVGLGIPLFKAAAEACNGHFEIWSKPGKGTIVQAEFQHSHIDRMPVGDLPGTFLNLLIAHPEISWKFLYAICIDGQKESFEFDDRPIKATLSGVPLSEPGVLGYLRMLLENGIRPLSARLLEKYRV